MMPISFKYTRLSEEEIEKRFKSLSPKQSDTPASTRSQKNISNESSFWHSRKVAADLKQKHEVLVKQLSLVSLQQKRESSKQVAIDKKINQIRDLRLQKQEEIQMLNMIRQEKARKEQELSESTQQLRSKISEGIRAAREEQARTKKEDANAIQKSREQNAQFIEQAKLDRFQEKKSLLNRVKVSKEHSYDTRCKFFTSKQDAVTLELAEKKRSFDEMYSQLQNEIPQLQRSTELAKEKLQATLATSHEKSSFMTTFSNHNNDSQKRTITSPTHSTNSMSFAA